MVSKHTCWWCHRNVTAINAFMSELAFLIGNWKNYALHIWKIANSCFNNIQVSGDWVPWNNSTMFSWDSVRFYLCELELKKLVGFLNLHRANSTWNFKVWTVLKSVNITSININHACTLLGEFIFNQTSVQNKKGLRFNTPKSKQGP